MANFEGKGRSDLGIEILIKSNEILNSITKNQSKAVR